MLGADRVIETSSPLDANNSFESVTKKVYGQGEHIERVVGTVYADQDGTLKVEFDDGSENWDGEETKDYTAGENLGFNVPSIPIVINYSKLWGDDRNIIVAPQFRIVYDNGDAGQDIFRLNAWQVT